MDRFQWDGTEAGFEALCVWPPLGQLALSHCHGRYVRVPTRKGVELLFPGGWLIFKHGEVHVAVGQ